MNEENANVIEKVKKLLRLAKSDNANEAALAAAKAQELIDRHKLHAALLELDKKPGSLAEALEGIEDFGDGDDTLTPDEKNVATWKWRLAYNVAKHNAVELYVMNYRKVTADSPYPQERKGIFAIGRPSDVAAVRYLFAYCVREVEKLVAARGPGHGRVWYNNYRLGVVDTIAKKLIAQREEFAKSVRRESGGGAALVKVNDALALLDERAHETRAWVKKNLKMRKTYGGGHIGNDSARAAGQKDGAKIDLRAGKSLGAGRRKALPG